MIALPILIVYLLGAGVFGITTVRLFEIGAYAYLLPNVLGLVICLGASGVLVDAIWRRRWWL